MTVLDERPTTTDVPQNGRRPGVLRRALPSTRTVAGGCVVALVLAVAFVVLYPVLRLIWSAFVPDGAVSFGAFDELFEARGFRSMVTDTVTYVIGVVVVATAIGGFLAWAMERTDARIDRLAGTMPVIPLLVPPIGMVLGYITLFAPESGYVNSALRTLLPIGSESGPISISNFPGLILITSVSFAPMSYMIIAAALRNADAALEEAARVSGAGRLRTTLRITLPTVRPAIFASALMIGILAVGAFTFPFFIGTSAGITTASVFVYRGFSSWPPQQEIAIALSLLMTLVVQVAVFAQQRAVRSQSRAVIAGKRSAASRLPLGRWRLVVRGFVLGYLMAVLLPIGALILSSLLGHRGAAISWANLTLSSYREVLSEATTRQAMMNSFVIGAVTAVIAITISAILVYASSVNRRGRFVEFVLYIPAAVPQTALAAAFIVSFAGPPFGLYGSAALLVLAYVTTFLPQASAASSAAVSQLNRELVEAAHLSAASPLRTARKVIAPQLIPGLFAGWVIVFFMAVNEVTISALLAGINNPVVGQVSVEFFETGRVPLVTAMAVIITVVSAFVVALTYRTVLRAAATTR